jgi:hypothetical protein
MSRVDRMSDAEVRRAYAVLFDARDAEASPIAALRQIVRACERQVDDYLALGFDWEPDDQDRLVRAGLLDADPLEA